eukprot:m.100617 g.100617  ORF g.100617 m.100617 type:complete len:359 (-) comp15135_c0_seq1:895-1971(-)
MTKPTPSPHRTILPTIYQWATHPLSSIQETSRWLAINTLKAGHIPAHVAFIMDGNRRFAKKHHVAKLEGHSAGFDKLKQTLEWCLDLGVQVVTVYAFSIENFKRSQDEVDGLMQLALIKFTKLLEDSEVIHRNQVSVRILGDVSMLPQALQQVLGKVVTMSAHYSKAVLNVCFAYTSQEEITMASNTIAQGVQNGQLLPLDVSDKLVEACLYTLDTPAVDLLIRSSGEVRLSDFMLWQAGAACLEFTSVLWPEFGYWDMMQCVFKYQQQHTRQQAMRAAEQVRQKRFEAECVEQLVHDVLETRDADNTSIETEQLTQSIASERRGRIQRFIEHVHRQRSHSFAQLAKLYDATVKQEST